MNTITNCFEIQANLVSCLFYKIKVYQQNFKYFKKHQRAADIQWAGPVASGGGLISWAMLIGRYTGIGSAGIELAA